MTDALLLARARGVPNPFRLNRIDSAWEGQFTDVPEINSAAFQRCRQTIEAVRTTGQSRGLLLTGEPGSGKSHLLHRLRQAIEIDGRDCFVYVPPVAGSGRLYSELLRRIINDLIREPGEGAANQLESTVVRELLSDTARARLTASQLWVDLRNRTPAGLAMFAALGPAMDRLTVRLQLDPDVALVLQHYLAQHHRAEAYRWLTGRSVPEAVAENLGVYRTLEADDDARQALFTLSKLAGNASVLVLAFDQLEGMQLRPDDLEGVIAFGNAVADLLINCRNVAAISCVQAYFRVDLVRALPPAHMARIEQDAGVVQLLDRETAQVLVAARINGDADLVAARNARGADRLWPLEAQRLEDALPLVDGGLVAARTVLNEARAQFEDWRAQGVAPSSADRRRDPNSVLASTFAALERQAATEAADEGTLADGLLKLLDLRNPGQVRRSTVKGIDVEIGTSKAVTGVSVCQAMNMASLAAKLKQVAEALEKGAVQRARIVRDARLPISTAAAKTQERVNWLHTRGHALIRSSAAAYAAIAAARRLLAEAAAGDLCAEGRTISIDDVRSWLLAEKPTEAFDLLDEIDAPSGEEADPVLDALREVLRGTWLIALDKAAARLGRSSTDVIEHLKGQRMVGWIAGPPALVYLKPDGLRRD